MIFFRNKNILIKIRNKSGYSLIELIVVIIIVGILTSVTLRSLRKANDTARIEQTKHELDQLAWAIAGNPELKSGGVRTDFGYVGDVGSLPPTLDALIHVSGSYVTWNGPYILDDFYPNGTVLATEFKIDGWGKAYTYTGGNTIISTGGSAPITRQIARSVNDLLYNTVSLAVTDLNLNSPGNIYKDSILFILSYPNGVGGTTISAKTPDPNGYVQFDSIPIGQHQLRVAYIPDNDTLTRQVVVYPGQDYYSQITMASDLW